MMDREHAQIEFAPTCCNVAAFEMMKRAASRIETPTALLEGAVAIARHASADASVKRSKHYINELARHVCNRVRGSQTQATLAHLHELLFVELGFVGNTLNYHDPENSYLPSVINTRRGLPISLSLIYKLVGERAGLTVHGLGLPGHFCAGVECDGHLMIIDAFYGGRLLNQTEALERIRDTYGQQVKWSDQLLKPVSHRHWLTRMMQNLLHTFSEHDQLTDVAAMLELELLLWPEQSHLQRDLALVLARLNKAQEASKWLASYLQTNPDDPQHDDLSQLLYALKD